MTDRDEPPDDPKGKRVKAAIGNKRRASTLTVIDGGKGEAPKPTRSRKAKAEAGEQQAERDTAPDEHEHEPDNDGSDVPSAEGLSEAELRRGRECALMDQNDRDNGRRLIAWFGLDLAYVQGMGWIVFGRTHWARDEGELQVRLMAQNLVDKIKLEAALIEASPAAARLLDAAATARQKPERARTAADARLLARADTILDALGKKRSARLKFAVASGNAGKTDAMLRQAASLKAVSPEALDANRMQFNCRNVTLTFGRETDLDCPDPDAVRLRGTLAVTPHNRDDLITKCAEVDYDPDATCPFFLDALAKVQPDEKMRLFIQIAHAYALLIGGNDEQVLLYHHGTGANGKSAFIEAIGRLAGGFRAVVAPETIAGETKQDGNKASGDIARLVSARLVTIEELPRGTPLRENLIKALTGGTRMVARFNFKELFEFEPQFTPILSGNDMPAVSPDYGIFRRLLIVPWSKTLSAEERVSPSELAARFDAERSGILNWLIEGLMLYLANGLTPYIPKSVRDYTDQYREERDPAGTFAKIAIIADPGNRVVAGELYKTFEHWCELSGVRPLNMTQFGTRLNALGYRKERGSRFVYYLDMRISDEVDRFDARASGKSSPVADPADPGWSPG